MRTHGLPIIWNHLANGIFKQLVLKFSYNLKFLNESHLKVTAANLADNDVQYIGEILMDLYRNYETFSLLDNVRWQ